MEMMIGAKTLFNISFSYINLHVAHMGPGFHHAIQWKMESRSSFSGSGEALGTPELRGRSISCWGLS